MIKTSTRAKIKGFLEGFLEIQLDKHQEEAKVVGAKEAFQTLAEDGKLKPFHNAILPAEIVRISSFERSFSTALGGTFEECARLIALDNHKEAERSKELTAQVSHACLEEIERARSIVDKGHGLNYPEMVKRVLKTSRQPQVSIRTITDVYIKTQKDEEYYFEIKSPKPNKGQGIEVTDRLLRTHAIRQHGPPKVNTYFAMAYNPYGTRGDYNHSFAVSHLDMQHQVLIQEEFWDIVGGKGTYPQLLEIYSEVGREKGRQVMKRLGYDF